METKSGIRMVEFLTRKYGPELLIDVGWIDDLPGFQRDVAAGKPHRLDFHDILLVTAGAGELWLDEGRLPVRPGTVLFTAPGQLRRWRVSRVAGLCLFFRAEFVQTYFNDPLFIHRLAYFDAPAAHHALPLATREADRLHTRLEDMRAEITHFRGDSRHLLRAMLYEVLIRLNRSFVARFGGQSDTQSNDLVFRYRQLVETHAIRHHQVSWYAGRLGVTPGHLNAAVRGQLGRTAKAYLLSRLAVEAKRRLIGGEAAGRVGRAIGFADPAYFARFFRRETGSAPAAFRARAAAVGD